MPAKNTVVLVQPYNDHFIYFTPQFSHTDAKEYRMDPPNLHIPSTMPRNLEDLLQCVTAKNVAFLSNQNGQCLFGQRIVHKSNPAMTTTKHCGVKTIIERNLKRGT